MLETIIEERIRNEIARRRLPYSLNKFTEQIPVLVKYIKTTLGNFVNEEKDLDDIIVPKIKTRFVEEVTETFFTKLSILAQHSLGFEVLKRLGSDIKSLVPELIKKLKVQLDDFEEQGNNLDDSQVKIQLAEEVIKTFFARFRETLQT